MVITTFLIIKAAANWVVKGGGHFSESEAGTSTVYNIGLALGRVLYLLQLDIKHVSYQERGVGKLGSTGWDLARILE